MSRKNSSTAAAATLDELIAPVAGDIVLFELPTCSTPNTIRPAMVTSVDYEGLVSLTAFLEPGDLMGHPQTAFYGSVQRGDGAGQWREKA